MRKILVLYFLHSKMAQFEAVLGKLLSILAPGQKAAEVMSMWREALFDI